MVTLKQLLKKAEPKLKGLNNVVRERTIQLITMAYGEKIYVGISQGFRSFAEQDELYAQGRTKPGNIVTNAKGGQSYHNYGLAVDFFIYSSDLKRVSWVVNDKWRRVASIAKELGFEWGGEWQGFTDYPHLQITSGLTIKQLQSGHSSAIVSKQKVSVTGRWNATTISEIQKLLKVPITRKLDTKTIKAWQKHMGVNFLRRNGDMDTDFIKLLQRWYGTTVDGVISKPSLLISKIQMCINKGYI